MNKMKRVLAGIICALALVSVNKVYASDAAVHHVNAFIIRDKYEKNQDLSLLRYEIKHIYGTDSITVIIIDKYNYDNLKNCTLLGDGTFNGDTPVKLILK